MFDQYKVDMALKGVNKVQYWIYVVRIEEWSDLMERHPTIWRGVLKCTDSYEELERRTRLPKCSEFKGCQCSERSHFTKFSHHHAHYTNVDLEMKAYNESLDAIGDSVMKRCVSCQ